MVITVQCPSCATSFPVDTAKIPEGGVNARCSACRAVFRVERPAEHPETIGMAEEAPSAAPLPPSEAMFRVEVEEEEIPFQQETSEPPPAEPVSVTEEEAGAEEEEEEEAVVEPSDAAAIESGATDARHEHGWAVEMQEDLDASSLEITPMETVESTVEETRDRMSEGSFSWEPEGFETSEDVMERAAEPEVEEEAGEAPPEDVAGVEEAWPSDEEAPLEEARLDEEAEAEGAPPIEEEAPEAIAFEEPEATAFEASGATGFEEPVPPAPTPEAPAPQPTKQFTFGHRDPHDKARRLARVLVSDMIMYNPDRHARALAGGTLKADFDDEIQKSWKEYVDQVGEEIANGTTYWPDALNDILAKGQQVF